MYNLFLSVVHQSYEAEADNEYVIRGNSVIMKCEIPSFVADFVSVTNWIDSTGKSYYHDNVYGIKYNSMKSSLIKYIVMYLRLLCIYFYPI